MSDQDGYNGWTNYETWLTALWIDNDQWTYNEARGIVRECVEMATDDVSTSHVADQLKTWAEEQFIDPVTENEVRGVVGLAVDLLRAAWSDVDFYEIAENWISEILQEADA